MKMQQLEGRRSFDDMNGLKRTGHSCDKVPYEFWLKLFGLIDSKLIDTVRDAASKGAPLNTLIQSSLHQPSLEKLRLSEKKITILSILTLFTFKRVLTMFSSDSFFNANLGDVTVYWLNSPVYYQFPLTVYLITALLIMRRFNAHEKDLKCFIPFAPIPEIAIPCQCYKRTKYKTRIRLMSATVSIVILIVSICSTYPGIAVIYSDNLKSGYQSLALVWMIVDCFVAMLALGLIMFSLLYFDCVCLIIGNKFRSIEEVIDEAALQCLKRRKEPQIFSSLTGLFNNYLDINDIANDSDHFWGRVVFYIIASHTAIFLFVTYAFIYNNESSPILKYYFIIIGSHSLFVLFKVCQSCYDVSYASAKRGYDNLSKINEFEAPKVVMMQILAFRRYMDSETIGYSGIYTKVTYETLFSWMFLIASLFLIIMDFANGTLPTGLSMKYI